MKNRGVVILLMMLMISGCSPSGSSNTVATPVTNCDFIQVTDRQVYASLRYPENPQYLVGVTLTLYNSGSVEVLEALLKIELHRSRGTVGIVTLKSGTIPPSGAVTLTGYGFAYQEPQSYTVNVVSCRLNTKQTLTQGNTNLAAADRARANGDLPLAEAILEQLAISQPGDQVTSRLVEVKLALGREEVKKHEWDSAEDHFRQVLTLRPDDPDVVAIIRSAMVSRNVIYFVVSAAVLVMVLAFALRRPDEFTSRRWR